jgi:glycosyltransferase involved in cell wall biosynthesis
VQHLDKTKYEVHVLSFTEGPMVEKLKEWGIPVYVIPTTTPFDVTVIKQVKELMVRLRIQIVHAHGTRGYSNIFWATKRLNIPVIYTVHGWSFHDDQSPMLKKLRIGIEKFLVRRAKHVILVSDANKATAELYFPFTNAVVIPNGIDLTRFNNERVGRQVRNSLPVGEQSQVVLFIARFIHQKQPLVLLRAFAKAVRENPGLHLWMVGDGDQKPEAMKLVEQLGIGEKVTIESFRSDVPEVLAAADIFVLPSLWEGLPIGLLEAMAMGKVAIGTKVDGTSEVIRDGENGLLLGLDNLEADLCTAIIKVAGDSELSSRLSANAIHTVNSSFNVVRMARSVEALYDGLGQDAHTT